MIYTVTFNPCLDYIVEVENFTLGQVNRTAKEELFPGGKGVNVSLVLKNLGLESTALGFTAGFTGEKIERVLKEWGCRTDFIRLPGGMSRINVKIRSGAESEVNGQGPAIPTEALEALYGRLERLKEDDVLVLAGSIPGSMPDSSYEQILERVKGSRAKTVIDASGGLLVKALRYKPFLIKPNHHELGEIFGVRIEDRRTAIAYAKKLQEMGVENVLVSMAENGAALLTGDGGVYAAAAPKGTVVHSVGAGDSMTAGFLAGYFARGDYAYAFCMGVAAGSASAFSEGLADREKTECLMKEIKVEELSGPGFCTSSAVDKKSNRL